MNNIINYMQYPFVRYAFVVAILVALCASFLGVILVIKRYSFIGDGLSHVAFGAMSIASIFNMTTNLYLVLPITIFAAVMILKSGRDNLLKSDAKLAMISVSALAVGYLLMNVFPPTGNISGDVCTTLFGSTSILTLKKQEVAFSIVIAILLLIFYMLYYNKIFAIIFDEDFYRAIGVKVERYNMMLSVIVAVVIVLGMNLVGSLLISALVIFPALAAMQIAQSFSKTILFSMIFSVFAAVFGLTMSIVLSTPVGSTIVMADLLIFLICKILGRRSAR